METPQLQYVGLREAAERLGVPPWRVQYAIAAGYVADVPRIAGKRLFDRTTIEQLLTHFTSSARDKRQNTE